MHGIVRVVFNFYTAVAKQLPYAMVIKYHCNSHLIYLA